MSGIRCYTNWNKRSADINPKIEPFRKYILYVKVRIQKDGISLD